MITVEQIKNYVVVNMKIHNTPMSMDEKQKRESRCIWSLQLDEDLEQNLEEELSQPIHVDKPMNVLRLNEIKIWYPKKSQGLEIDR